MIYTSLIIKKRPIGDINDTWVDSGETESPHIEMLEPDTDINYILDTESPHIELIKPETDLDPISAITETLPELVERWDMPTIDL